MSSDAPFLFLLPAAAAYWLLTRSWQFCYRLRHERPGLVAYQVVLSGSFLLGLALILNKLCLWASPTIHATFLELIQGVIAPVISSKNAELAFICFISLVLGLLSPRTLNWVAALRGRGRNTYYLRANRDDAFEAQWYAALQTSNFSLIQLTLDTNKVYIGIVAQCPATATGYRRSIQLLPLASGYRDPQTLRLMLTTDYVEASEKIGNNAAVADQFEVVIRADRIVSSSPFDFVLYSGFGNGVSDRLSDKRVS